MIGADLQNVISTLFDPFTVKSKAQIECRKILISILTDSQNEQSSNVLLETLDFCIFENKKKEFKNEKIKDRQRIAIQHDFFLEKI